MKMFCKMKEVQMRWIIKRWIDACLKNAGKSTENKRAHPPMWDVGLGKVL